jgi:hypothetical protein
MIEAPSTGIQQRLGISLDDFLLKNPEFSYVFSSELGEEAPEDPPNGIEIIGILSGIPSEAVSSDYYHQKQQHLHKLLRNESVENSLMDDVIAHDWMVY